MKGRVLRLINSLSSALVTTNSLSITSCLANLPLIDSSQHKSRDSRHVIGMAQDHTHSESCSCVLSSGGVSQTMEELDFERGLWSAALNGEEERVKKLLATGSSPNALDSSGYTPLHYASRSGHASSCQLLVSSGADVNAQTPGGVTPLHRAAYCGHVNVVRLLLDHRADASRKDSDGKTPLHKAAERGHYSVAELLVTFCPSIVEEKDGKGQSAREMVKEMNDNWRTLLCKD